MSKLLKTEAIVLSSLKYRDSSLIVRMFTTDHGHQSFIINGVRSAKAKMKAALFQPFSLLHLVYYENKSGELHRISEIKSSYPFKHIPFDVAKSSIVLFLSEIMQKSLRDEGENIELFAFIKASLIFLDNQDGNIANFHLRFLLKVSAYLGFNIGSSNALVTQLEEAGSGIVNEGTAAQLHDLMQSEYGEEVKVSKADRHQLLLLLIDFFRLHIGNFSEVKSLSVLQEILA